MRRAAVIIAVAGGLLAAAPAQADWTASVADLQTVTATDVKHDVAVDDAGNGLAVWDAPVAGRTVIRARRYAAAAGAWETPVRELSVPTGTASSPVVAMDRAGNGMVLWQRYVNEQWTVQARRFDRAAGAWESTAATLSVGAEHSVQPALAFEADGDAFAVWRADGVIRARRYDSAAGAWESASAVLSSDTGGANLPAVQVDAGGVATVAWQTDGAIEAKRYDAAKERWPAVATRVSAAGETASGVRLGVDEAGVVSAVWSAMDASGTFVQSRRFDGGVWGAPALLSPKVGTAYAPQLAVAPGGVATVVWYAQADGKFVVRARRWTGDRWDPAATLSNPSTNAWSPTVAVDKAGRATVAWRRPGGPSTIEARRFDGTWGTGPTVLSGTTDAEAPELAVGPRGDALAVWQRPTAGTVTVQARRFVAPPVVSPADEPALTAAPSTPLAALPSDASPASAPVAPRVSPRASVPDAPEITRLRVGSRIALRLSAPAKLRVTFERRTARGWRATPGTIELPAVQRGDVRLKFALAAGRRYRVKVVATDVHGRHTVARATFRT